MLVYARPSAREEVPSARRPRTPPRASVGLRTADRGTWRQARGISRLCPEELLKPGPGRRAPDLSRSRPAGGASRRLRPLRGDTASGRSRRGPTALHQTAPDQRAQEGERLGKAREARSRRSLDACGRPLPPRLRLSASLRRRQAERPHPIPSRAVAPARHGTRESPRLYHRARPAQGTSRPDGGRRRPSGAWR